MVMTFMQALQGEHNSSRVSSSKQLHIPPQLGSIQKFADSKDAKMLVVKGLIAARTKPKFASSGSQELHTSTIQLASCIQDEET